MNVVKNLLRSFNSFQSQQFFRFEGEPQFTNVLGGVFTLIIRVLLLSLLAIKLTGVFTYSKVNTIVTTLNDVVVVNQTLSPINQTAPFLIAFEVLQTIGNLDRATFLSYSKVKTLNVTNKSTFLEICTPDHWIQAPSFFEEISAVSIKTNSYLFCLPTNFTHQMSIDQTATLQIYYLFNCQVNCTTIPKVQIQIRPILLNTLVNSQQSDNYVMRYLDKKMYYPIDTLNGNFDTVLQYYMENYSIDTDHSLMPWSSQTSESGFYYPMQPIASYRPNSSPSIIFLRTFFQLNNQQQYHQRSFVKIFDAISLVGGLVPIFMIVFLWLNYYALSHFEMTFIKKLHSDQKAKEYGIFFFFSKFIYSVLTTFNFSLDAWQRTREYHKMHKTVNKLIDILYLYKRLEFIERALQVLFDDHQIKVLHLMRNKTFSEAEHNVQLYQMKDNLSKIVEQHKIIEEPAQPTVKTSSASARQISLNPYPSHVNDPPDTDKPFATNNQFQGKSSQYIPKTHTARYQLFELNKRPTNQEDSEYNEDVQKQQIKDLRQAYSSYERLRRQAQDSNSEYYNYISRNILKKLDNVDRRLLDDLELLLHEQQKEQIIAKIVQSLQSKEYENIERSLFRRGSKYTDRDRSAHRQHQENVFKSSAKRRDPNNLVFKPSM